LFFLPAAMFGVATAALVAGSVLAALAVLIPLAWVFWKAAPPYDLAMLCFLFTAFLMVQSTGTYNVLFMIHADAPAVGFATVACGLLLGKRLKPMHWWLAGVASSMAVGAKQTMAPVVIALAVYLLLVDGVRPALHFLCAAAAAGILLLAVILTAWPPRDVVFNIWTLAGTRPMKHDGFAQLMAAFRTARMDALPALLPVLFIGAYCGRKGIRVFLRENRWVVFALCGAGVLPVSMKAMVTVGSDVNHPGVVLYFLFAAAGLAIQQHAGSEDATLRMSVRLFLWVGILVGLAPGLAFAASSGWAHLRDNPAQVAAEYSQRHAGRAYFPLNPSAGIRADGRFYHLDPALFDREIAGYALTRQQLKSGLAEHFRIMAMPPGEQVTSRVLSEFISKYPPITDPELPGWTVLSAPQ
jgi:hypothetical protein